MPKNQSLRKVSNCIRKTEKASSQHKNDIGPARHILTKDLTIQNMNSPMKNWRLIHFQEFYELKMSGALVPNNAIKWRLGTDASVDEIQKAVLNARDIRNCVKNEAETIIQQMMLEEAQQVFPKIGKEVPCHFKDIRRNWGQDCTIENAKATWHILYGMFDELDMDTGRRGPIWQKKLEKIIMQRMSIAYISETVTHGMFVRFCGIWHDLTNFYLLYCKETRQEVLSMLDVFKS